MKRTIISMIIGFLLANCGNKKLELQSISSIKEPILNKKDQEQFVQQDWYFLDVIDDSIPGISLNKAYDKILKHKNGKPVIVAVIDMPIDINHEDLKKNIWVNNDEIPNNDIDDDQNGYIDDINGWNFIGNNKGESNLFVNYEYTRILKKYDPIFNEKNSAIKDSSITELYRLAQKKYLEQLSFAKEDSAYISMVSNSKKNAESFVREILKSSDKKITLKLLDSLKLTHPRDTILSNNALILSNFINYGFTKEYITSYELKANSRLTKLLNKNYNDREFIGDDPDDIKDINYGNNIVNSNVGFFDHGTLMAGFIAGDRDNTLGIKGFSDNIKLMCLPVSSFGNEYDKDIALAIRYAVDNGAKVINMSIGKEFSLQKEFVFEALKHAENNNVLVVSGAGNSRYNLDLFNHYYPNDNENNNPEVSENFIKVGASTYRATQDLVADFTNYGSYDIDIFAPGIRGYSTTSLPEKYTSVSGGSSMSTALTSGTAALLYSYFPELSANQIKQIIIDSGVKFEFEVNIPSNKKNKETAPLTELSKSGKVVNVYNALLLAEQVSRTKNL